MMTNDHLFSIGELSKRSGVPVKTIRHYADEGILPPTSTSDANYRLYSQDDLRKLGVIRSLRALGFSLPAIASMLDGSRDPQDVAELQLDLVETQLRALERQRSILRAARALRDPQDVLRHLDAAFAAATLGAAERNLRLERWLARATPPRTGDDGAARIRAMVLENLPAELAPQQLEAWVRLSALLEDEGLLETLRLQHQPFADEPVDEAARAAFGAGLLAILARVYPLVAQEASADDPRVGELVDEWTALFARTLRCDDDASLREWLLQYARRTNDPRIERFWNEVAAMRGMPAMPPMTRAQALLIDGLSLRSGETG